MTIDRKRPCRICLCALCILFTLCLISCTAENNFSELEALQDGMGVKITTYYIVLPSGCSSELALSAEGLASQIQDAQSVSCKVIYDSQSMESDIGTMPIYLGNADGKLKECVSGLRRDDYVYSANSEYILLGGLYDKASCVAIDKFLSDVLPNCETVNIFEYEGDFSYSHTYEYDSFMLCGFDVGEYDIIHSESRASNTQGIAEALRNKIADKTGAYPELLSEGEQKAGRRELVLRLDENENENICFDGEDILLTAHDTYGLSVLVEQLYSLMLDNIEGKTSNVNISERINVLCNTPTFSAVAVFADLESLRGLSLQTNAEQIGKELNELDTQVLLFSNVTSEWLNLVMMNVSNFTLLPSSDVGEGIYAVAYRSTAVSCETEFDAAAGMINVKVTPKLSENSFELCSVLEPTAQSAAVCSEKFSERIKGSQGDVLGIYSAFDMTANNTALDTVKSINSEFGAESRRTYVYADTELVACEVNTSATHQNASLLKLSAEMLFNKAYLENIYEG